MGWSVDEIFRTLQSAFNAIGVTASLNKSPAVTPTVCQSRALRRHHQQHQGVRSTVSIARTKRLV
jgi:hypothetical protein